MAGALGDFLRACRERLRPEEIGLPADERRRVPGLRREELASAAGVSVGYYTRLEQGHDRSPSAGVIDALADALRLDSAGRRHLRALTQPPGRIAGRPGASGPERVRGELIDLLNAHVDAPALIVGRALDVLVANPLATVLHPSYQSGRNLALDIFGEEWAVRRYEDPERVRRERAGALRVAAGAAPDDPRVVEIVGELSVRSAPFRHLWASQRIHSPEVGVKRFIHPEVGAVELRYSFFSIAGAELQRLLIYHPEPQTRHAQSLVLLSTLAAASASALDRPPTRKAPGT